ncbi:MAG: hypothetical protein HWE10_06810 [Gammaproteobacteria bacterium]|nr:hypothetical protein [Gammaproteobacteria bacterium]
MLSINRFKMYLVMLVVLSLYLCRDSRPSFDAMINNYQENTEVFMKLAKLSCQLGEKGELKFYEPRSFEYVTNPVLDAYLGAIDGKSVVYTKNSDGSCGLSVYIWGMGFAGSGNSYRYKYQPEAPKPYDPAVHIHNKIINNQKDVEFDMPLTHEAQFDNWYFNYKNT